MNQGRVCRPLELNEVMDKGQYPTRVQLGEGEEVYGDIKDQLENLLGLHQLHGC